VRTKLLAKSVRASTATCPPHYWQISHDAEGERWDCNQCPAVKRPTPPRFINWGERACTWSREERILAGLDPASDC
jgi:hypothetical protein